MTEKTGKIQAQNRARKGLSYSARLEHFNITRRPSKDIKPDATTAIKTENKNSSNHRERKFRKDTYPPTQFDLNHHNSSKHSAYCQPPFEQNNPVNFSTLTPFEQNNPVAFSTSTLLEQSKPVNFYVRHVFIFILF